jgi:hypothetical protein
MSAFAYCKEIGMSAKYSDEVFKKYEAVCPICDQNNYFTMRKYFWTTDYCEHFVRVEMQKGQQKNWNMLQVIFYFNDKTEIEELKERVKQLEEENENLEKRDMLLPFRGTITYNDGISAPVINKK